MQLLLYYLHFIKFLLKNVGNLKVPSLPKGKLGRMLNILTSVWVLRTPNACRNIQQTYVIIDKLTKHSNKHHSEPSIA